MGKRSDLGLRLIPPPGPDRDAFAARFWSRVDRSAPDGCWPWTGNTSDRGYGQITIATKGKDRLRTTVPAHRVAFFLSRKGEDPGEKDVDHTCRNRLCCRPKHLCAVMHKDNVPRGEDHGHAILDPDLVQAIRAAALTGATGAQIALQLGIKPGTVYNVLSGRNWAHV